MTTLARVADELQAVRITLAGTTRSLDNAVTDLSDHETRIRLLEQWRYAVPATLATSALSAIAAVVAAYMASRGS